MMPSLTTEVSLLVKPAYRCFRFAIFERTSSNLPPSPCQRGNASPYEVPPGRAKRCCCVLSRTLIPMMVW